MRHLQLFLLLLFSVNVLFGNSCTDAKSGNWSAASTWTSCGATIPQAGDKVTINSSTITLDTNTNIGSISLANTGKVKVDGLTNHTITCTATTTCITVNNNAVFDTSAGSAIAILTITAANLASGNYVIYLNNQNNPTLNLQYASITNSNRQQIVAGAGWAGYYTFSHNYFANASAVFSQTHVQTFIATYNTISNMTGNVTFSADTQYGTPGTFTDNTEIGVLATGVMLKVAYGDVGGWNVSRNAVISDVAGQYSRAIVQALQNTNTNGATLVEYNIGKTYAVTTRAIQGCAGAPAYPCVFDHNVLDGFYQAINVSGGYSHTSYNVLIETSAAYTGQGLIFAGYYNGLVGITSSNDMMALDSDAENVLYFCIGGSSTPVTCTITNDTTVGMNRSHGYQFGEGFSGAGYSVTGSSLSNSIAVGGLYGTLSGNSSDAFATNGTGGVGISNNDVFGATTAYGYLGSSFGINFGTGHPSATYGDVTLDPHLVSSTRRFQDCDRIFGGPGTVADLFTQLANRWNNTNDARFTPQNIWACMAQAFQPQNVGLAHASSSGSYVGAMPVVSLISAGVQ
jgi:hypothetical protein